MRIAFVYQSDPLDIRAWSGTPYYMVKALRDRGHEVTIIGPLTVPFEFPFKVYKQLVKWSGRHYDITRHPYIAKAFGKQAKREIEKSKFDFVLSPSTIPVAFLDLKIPVVFWTDATLAGMVGFYPGVWDRFSIMALRHGHEIEQRSLKNATYACFSSQWAAESANANYLTHADRVRMIPFGANLAQVPSRIEVNYSINLRSDQECRFLFIGVEWDRKGGDLVIETAINLHNQGINVHVEIVGCNPPYPVPAFVNCHGFISKASSEGQNRLKAMLLGSSFVFVPSYAECAAMVFAEASAHGTPSISRSVGGIPTVIRNGVNGFTLPKEAGAEEYASAIKEIISDHDLYRKLCLSSRDLYESELNWDSAVASLEQLILTKQ